MRTDLMFNNLQWPIKKSQQVIWGILQDFDRIKWKRTLMNPEEAPNMAYHNILNEFSSTRGVKGFIVTHSNLVVMWKVRPHMGIIFWFPLGVCWLCHGDCIFIPFLQSILINLCQKQTNYENKTHTHIQITLDNMCVLVNVYSTKMCKEKWANQLLHTGFHCL